MKMICIYWLLVNIGSFLMYGADKRKAIRHQWRIPERVLIGIAVIGGSVGALMGMWFFRHKTKHPKFFIGVPLVTAVQVIIFFLVVRVRL